MVNQGRASYCRFVPSARACTELATSVDNLGHVTSADSVPPADPATSLDPQPVPLTEPADGVPPVVDTTQRLAQMIAAIRAGSGPISVDAERASGYRYSQRAYLVQVRREGSGTHLLDPIGFGDLTELATALGGEEWIFHAASQDLACLAEIGLVPESIFDTEVAARILGKPRVGLAALAESELGVSLAKEHSAADWSTRPLPDSWLRYAALDVELLLELRGRLAQDLHDLDRWEWAQEEFEFVLHAPQKPTRAEPWRRTSGIHKARSPQQLAIVRELWIARDNLAEKRDIAGGRVLPDAAIAAAALAKVKNKAELAALPNYQGRGTKRRIDYWWDAVERALTTETDQLPKPGAANDGPPPPRSWNDRSPAAAARLAAAREVITTMSDDLGIPAENILTPDTLRRLCWSPPPLDDVDSVKNFLTDHGARNWQADLTGEAIYQALTQSTPPD